MKRLILVLAAVVLITVYAHAEGSPKGGEFGVQTSVGLTSTGFSPSGSLGAKYWISNAMALRGSLGFVNTSAGTGYDLGAGFEYHFGGKGGVSPYAGAQLGYSGASLSGGGTAPSAFGLNLVFGGEYFFSDNFSWAGEVHLGFNSSNNGVATATTFGTAEALFILTWYIN